MNTFAFVDAVATKDKAKAFSEIEDLRMRGVSPVFMIAVLGSHFGLMWKLKNPPIKELPGLSRKSPGSSSVRSQKALEQSRRWTFSQLEKAIRLLCDVDESLKTGKIDPVSSMDYMLVNLFAE